MNFIEVLSPESVETNVSLNNKTEIIEYLVKLASKTGKVIDSNDVINDVMEREKILSTGIGKGIALPHAKTKGISDFVASLITLKNPIDFDSLDSEPVSICVMLLGLEGQVGTNLKLLSKLSKIINVDEQRNAIIFAKSAVDICNLLKKFEE
jgi:mannitol/fructose-specific phosphotransferase system IIA component (Ntr-type)